jgi:hypothetical protein
MSPQNAFDLAFVVQARGSNFAILTARKQAGTQLTAAMAAADSGQQPLDERRRILGRGRASGPGKQFPKAPTTICGWNGGAGHLRPRTKRRKPG